MTNGCAAQRPGGGPAGGTWHFVLCLVTEGASISRRTKRGRKTKPDPPHRAKRNAAQEGARALVIGCAFDLADEPRHPLNEGVGD
jgi:hypothetical protein